MATLATLISTIANGQAGLTGMSATQVSSTSWQIAGNAISCFVAPAFSGSQSSDVQGDGYDVIHRVLVEYTFRPNPNIAAMYTNAAAMLDRVITWFRQNDTLSKAVATCHAEPLRWEATELRTPENEIVSKTLTFTAAIGQYV